MLTLSERIDLAAAAPRFGPRFPEPLDFELAFTRRHQAGATLSAGAREVAALELLFPAILQPIQPGDRFAGRIHYPLVGLSPEPGGFGYYCRAAGVQRLLDEGVVSGARAAEARAMLTYWERESSQARTRAAYPSEVARLLPTDAWFDEPGVAFPLYRLAGTVLDYATLLRLGLPGLRARAAAAQRGEFRAHALAALALLEGSLRFYAAQADALASDSCDAAEAAGYGAMADRVRALLQGPPRDLLEAIQLLWIYALHSGTWNYGRLDDVLGPFLEADLATGRLTAAAAQEVLEDFWRLIAAYSNQYNNRVIVGGRGRSHPPAADAFARLAIEATRRVRLNQPQLSLRFSADQDPALYEAALDAIGEGCTYPLLYNDDVYVPAVQRAYGLPVEEAEQYLPYGCGETMFAHRSLSSPNGVLNLVECLRTRLLAVADADAAYTNFERLWQAYAASVEEHLAALAIQQRIEYDVAGREAPFLFLSLLTDDCLARGAGLCQGGVRRLEGCVETYGNTNVADALAAIRRVVFLDRAATLREVADACRNDFVEAPDLRRRLLAAPKFGNDDPEADAMAVRVHEHVCRAAAAQADPAGLAAYHVVIINNWANTVLGRHTGASPDGRLAGEAFANANNPSPGRDQRGVTAFLQSLVKLDPGLHAGAVQNMKFSPGLFTRDRARLEGLLAAYWRLGGSQAMITVVDRDDLLAAMREPEKWGHLMVRVGGFSIRFVDLPPAAQREVLERTLHE